MANKKQHFKIGAAVGAGVAGITNLSLQLKRMSSDPNYKFNLSNFLLSVAGGGVLGGVAGVVPDLLEPARHSHHRKVFHSVTTGAAIAYGMYKASKGSLTDIDKAVINVAGAGYISHLVLDSETHRGIPVLHKSIL